MTTSIEAVYEHGTLRPLNPLALQEGETVEIVLVHRRAKTVNAAPVDLLAAIAALPDEAVAESFSNRQHDEILYGERAEK